MQEVKTCYIFLEVSNDLIVVTQYSFDQPLFDLFMVLPISTPPNHSL